ncbi:MAG: type IV pilus secretin PilQ [Gammaproteobacteria bacterium]|nr:type IV pilus secretin PilQ [Gammaproteobacteria bacterium]
MKIDIGSCRLLWVLTGFCVWNSSLAANLDSLRWEGQGDETALIIQVDGQAEYETAVLNDNKKLRVIFRNTQSGPDVLSLPGQGIFQSVTPSVSPGGVTTIDIDLSKPAQLSLVPSPSGYRVAVVPGTVESTMSMQDEPIQDENASSSDTDDTGQSDSNVIAQSDASQSIPASPSGSANVLRNIAFSPLPGGRVQINLQMDSPPEDPGRFITNQPPRIALDFLNTSTELQENVVDVGAGAVVSIAAVEADELTRLVINLVRPVAYETEILPDGIAIIVEGAQQVAGVARPSQFDKAAENNKYQFQGVDFRRTPEGGGKITVNLSDPTVGVDIREEAGEIIVDFLETGVASELEQRLDVVDFATPVQFIDTFSNGKHTRMIVSPVGRYTQAAYQAGNIFNLDVLPIVEGEEEVVVDEFGYSGEKLSLNFQKIDVRAALNVIADFTGINFVTSDSVSGNLSLRLKDVPWDQALDIILQTKGLGKRQKGNVIWVAPAEEIAAKERLALEAQASVAELEPLTSELIQINYAPAKDIATLLKSIKAVETGFSSDRFGSVSIENLETESNSLLSPRGQVTIDERTNTLLVQDTAGKIREIRKLIAKLDRPVRQVVIETRIVEANETFSRNLGARLSFQQFVDNAQLPLSSDSDIGNVVSSGTLEGTDSIFNDNEFLVNTDGLAVDLRAPNIGADRVGSYAFNIFKIGSGFQHLINLEISALEAEGEGKIVANPKIMTADQQEATIKQGQEVVLDRVAFDVSAEAVTEEAVLELTVTPRITPDDRVTLDVLVKQEDFVTNDLKNTKEITTEVLLDNGETVVIGGIYQQEETQSVTKIPILGDIPLLGNMFRKKTRDDERRELLIFLTPRILSPNLTVN